MKSINRKTNARILGMAVAGIIAVIVIVIFSSMVVRSAQADSALEKYYTGLESEYKYMVRDYMNENGYINAGIMVTRVVDAEGNRTYTVKLHHDKLDRLNEEELAAVMQEVSELGFADELCSFNTIIIK